MSLGTSTYKLSDTLKSKGKVDLMGPLENIGEIKDEGNHGQKSSHDQVEASSSE